MSSTVLRRSTRWALVPTLLVAAATLSACGGDDPSSTATNARAGTGTGQAAPGNGTRDMSALRDCLKKEGVELPERPAGAGAPPADAPNGNGNRGGLSNMSDAEREKFQKAVQKCGGGRGPGRGPNAGGRRPDVSSAAYQRSIKAYVACVRQQGYDLPDPDFSGRNPIFDPKKVGRQDAKFRKASAACQSKLRTS